jgi:predicted RNA-binding protein YlxR (DUF448 family)
MEAGPVRTCVACLTKRDRAQLIRVARGPDGTISVRPDAPGRGAYVCSRRTCIETAIASGRLRRALRAQDALPEGLEQELLERI